MRFQGNGEPGAIMVIDDINRYSADVHPGLKIPGYTDEVH